MCIFEEWYTVQKLVLPGPAVTAATPTVPESLATASAAKTALT